MNGTRPYIHLYDRRLIVLHGALHEAAGNIEIIRQLPDLGDTMADGFFDLPIGSQLAKGPFIGAALGFFPNVIGRIAVVKAGVFAMTQLVGKALFFLLT